MWFCCLEGQAGVMDTRFGCRNSNWSRYGAYFAPSRGQFLRARPKSAEGAQKRRISHMAPISAAELTGNQHGQSTRAIDTAV
jgi:hypothetical protein